MEGLPAVRPPPFLYRQQLLLINIRSFIHRGWKSVGSTHGLNRWMSGWGCPKSSFGQPPTLIDRQPILSTRSPAPNTPVTKPDYKNRINSHTIARATVMSSAGNPFLMKYE